VPPSDVVGEFGRYTVASHSVLLWAVGAIKASPAGAPNWYLVNVDGSR
jgi:arginine decarboxylase